MVRRQPGQESFAPLPEAENVQVLLRERPGPPVDDLGDLRPLVLRREPQAGQQALVDGGVAAVPAEDEGDRRQQAGAVQPLDDVRSGGGSPPRPVRGVAAARPAAAPAVDPTLVLAHVPHQFRVDDRRAALPGGLAARGLALLAGVGGRAQREQVEHPVTDEHVLPERHRPHLADHDRRVAADGDQPLAELLGVAHRRRQRDQGDRLREVDDHLLPDGTAEPVGEVVHLVHDHVAEAVDRRGVGVEHVAEHLGGHHDHRRVAVDRVVPGQQADLVLAVPIDQVGVLLVGQRLDRRRVERLAALGEGLVDGELAHHGLPGTGGCADEDTGALVERLARLDLERVEGKVQLGDEAGQRRMGGPAPGGGVPLSGAGHAPTLGARTRIGSTAPRGASTTGAEVTGRCRRSAAPRARTRRPRAAVRPAPRRRRW